MTSQKGKWLRVGCTPLNFFVVANILMRFMSILMTVREQ